MVSFSDGHEIITSICSCLIKFFLSVQSLTYTTPPTTSHWDETMKNVIILQERHECASTFQLKDYTHFVCTLKGVFVPWGVVDTLHCHHHSIQQLFLPDIFNTKVWVAYITVKHSCIYTWQLKHKIVKINLGWVYSKNVNGW